MDIEDTQKINTLANELMQNGIACSRDEAYQKAQSMICATEEVVEEKPDERLQILEQRYKFMLNSQNSKFTEEITNLKNALCSMSAELIELKRKFRDFNQAAPTPGKPRVEVQSKLIEDEKQDEQPADDNGGEMKNESPIENDHLKPEEFSVEKYFYCGNKG